MRHPPNGPNITRVAPSEPPENERRQRDAEGCKDMGVVALELAIRLTHESSTGMPKQDR
jgi:hypothetical protein